MLVALCAFIWQCPLVPVSLGAGFFGCIGKLRCEPVASDFFIWQTASWLLFIWQIELIASYIGCQLLLGASCLWWFHTANRLGYLHMASCNELPVIDKLSTF